MRFKGLFACLCLLVSPFSWAENDVKVLASIKPLQLIAEAIVADTGQVELLIRPGASPHHYSMKPSDIRKLSDTGLVIWVGPDLERFMVKTLNHVNAPVLQMVAKDENEVMQDGHQALTPTSAGDGHHDHKDGMHVWLDPLTTLSFAKLLSETLAGQYPVYQAQFNENYLRFESELLTLDGEIRNRLQPFQEKGFFVFHDAWGHFIEHYGLNQKGYFSVDPGRKPGVRRLAVIRQQLEQAQASCVFSEPQFRPAIIKSVVEGLAVDVGEIDPLATEAPHGRDGYVAYLSHIAEQFEVCLGSSK